MPHFNLVKFSTKVVSCLSVLSLLFSFLSLVTIPANAAGGGNSVYNLNNNPISVGQTQNKPLSLADLYYYSTNQDLNYYFYNYQEGNFKTLYVHLNNYPASVICVDGNLLNEQGGSGSGIFDLSGVNPANNSYYTLWIPVNTGECTTIPSLNNTFLFNFLGDYAAILDVYTQSVPDSSINYTVLSLPTHSSLVVNSLGIMPQMPSSSFTQDDINNGRVSIVTNGSPVGPDSFSFSVNDGYSFLEGTYNFNIVASQSTGGVIINLNSLVTPPATKPAETPNNSNNSTPTQTSNSSPNNQTEVQQVINKIIENFYIFGLKSLGMSSNKAIMLDADLKISKLSGLRNSPFTFTLSKVSRVDPELKTLSCELVQSSDSSKVFASGNLDESGKCVITWTPGNSVKRGRFVGFVKITDTKRNHTYITRNFTLNLR